jgi:hypothetical protein
MEYINDVFISYKRGWINEQWLEEIFLPFFREYLNEVLDHKPVIFVDKTGLVAGVDFDDQIFKNLVLSRSFVSIWSPPYFRRSEWCVKEFLTMKYQQQLYKIDVDGTPPTLIWPLLLRKLNPVPTMIEKIQYLDYSDFNVIGEPFFKSELFLKFQQKLSNDVNLIAHIINNAPELHEDFKTKEGRAKITDEINVYLKDNGEQFDFPKQGLISW